MAQHNLATGYDRTELDGFESKNDIATTGIQDPASHLDAVDAVETAFVGLTKVQAMRKFWRACLFCSFTTFGVIMDGYQTSFPGGILANKGFIQQVGTVVSSKGVLSINAKYVSLWAGMGYLAQFSGNFLGGLLSDRFGRRSVLYAFTIVFVVGIVVEMVTKNWKHWLVAKMLMGLGQGLVQQGVLTYISEIAPAQIRGTLMSTYGWGYALGQLFAAVCLNEVNTTDPNNWHKAVYTEWIPMGIWILLVAFLPESPWFYARKNNPEAAKRVLNRLYKGVDGYDVEREYIVVEEEVARQNETTAAQSQGSWKSLFVGSNLRRTFASVFGLVMQNWSGSSVIFNYTTYFFQQAGIPKPFQATVIVDCILIGSIMASFYAVERLGRRTLILTGGVGCCVFNILIGATGFMGTGTSHTNAALAFICIWVVLYATCFASTCWTVAAEIATPALRAKTSAFAISTNAISGALFNSTVPLMIAATSRNWGVKALFMFAILTAVGTVINYFLLPETKGRTFSELDELYGAKIAPRNMRNHITAVERSGLKKH